MQRGLDVCGDVGRGGSKVEGDGYLGEEDLEIHVNSWKLVCGDRLSLSLLLKEGGRRRRGREGDVDSG